MNIIITGAAGMLGSHMTDKCLSEGHTVYGIDDLSSGNFDNLEHHKTNPNFKFIKCDTQFFDWDFVPKKINQIYNFASLASPPLYQAKPMHCMMTNIMGTKNMLEFAADRKAQFFQASTSECYGDALEVPQRENYFGNVNTVGPRACYDESKRMAETLCYEFKKNEGVKVKIARIFNTFSERISPQDGRIISNFVLQALRGENITVYGDGLQTRSLLYVDDAIEAYWNFMNKTPDDFTGPMNIGSEQEHTVLSIAKKIIELTHSQSKIIFCDLPQDDPLRRKPSLSLARKMINFEQKVSLADGIQKVIAEYRK